MPTNNRSVHRPILYSFFFILLSFILLLAAGLRFYCLPCSSLWHDEGNTWALMGRSFSEIATAAAADIHPPGYYWLLKLWSMLFGDSATALRALSALAGTLTVLVVYGIGERGLGSGDWGSETGDWGLGSDGSRTTHHAPCTTHHANLPISQSPNLLYPLLAALLVALNPFQIFYSQEARMYGLLMLQSAALVWAGMRVVGAGTGDWGLGTGDRGSGTGDWGLGTGDRGLGTGDRGLGTGDWGLGTGTRTTHHAPRTTPISQYPNLPISNLQYPILYALILAAGLWTHYIFPIVAAAVGLGGVYAWWRGSGIGDWGLGTGDWGAGTGDRGAGTGDRGAGTGEQAITHHAPRTTDAADAPRTTHHAPRTTGAADAPRTTHHAPRQSPNHPITQSPNLQYPISNPPSLLPFLLANGLGLALFLPWLPTAVERLWSWPAGGESVGPLTGLGLTLQTLAVGPIRTGPELAWPWLALVGVLPLIGLWRMRRSPWVVGLALWLLLPVITMFTFGLFTDSFLKFLIVASPAWCLAVAGAGIGDWGLGTGERGSGNGDAASQPLRDRGLGTGERGSGSGRPRTTHHAPRTTPITHLPAILLAALCIGLAAATLPGYYADPFARDNYAGMARTVAALGDPARDGALLNAPGQAEVWAYYDPGLPVFALPQERPPDRGRTEAALAQAVADRSQIFALFWATEQSDPEGIVEGWLDRNLFKGLESWQGNVRFVVYSQPAGLGCQPVEPPARFGEMAELSRVCVSPDPIRAGENWLIQLHWRGLTPVDRPYKGTVQLLNAQGQVIAQQDGEPGGGSLPTTAWLPGQAIVDNRAIFIPPGTPPLDYGLILALYDGESGARLPVDGGDALGLGSVTVARPSRGLPAAIVPMQARLNRTLGGVTLLGADLYRRGFAHAPDTPLQPGDLLHVTLYWQAGDAPLPPDQGLVLSLGGNRVAAPLAGGGYATGEWQPGEIVRGEFDIPWDGTDRTLWLTLDGTRLRIGSVLQ